MASSSERAQERENARRRRSRIPNVVIDNLEDLIVIFLDEVQVDIAEMQAWIAQREQVARKDFDNRQLADLLKLSQLLARHQEVMYRAERKVRDARSGDYREKF